MQGSDFHGLRWLGYVVGALCAIGVATFISGVIIFIMWCINHVRIV